MNTPDQHVEQPLVEAFDVSFNHRDRHILHSVNLQVRAGEIVTLIGPNGAGKTTLLKIILGLLQPSAGRIQLTRGLRIGYMPQKLNLNSNLPITVRRFLQLTLKDNIAIENILHEMSIQHLRDTELSSISGGELQRVLLARAMLHRPDLLVLDEPAQGVDIAGQGALYTLINQLKHRYHCGVLMVSHDLHLVMATTDVVICLNQHICCEGHPDSVSSDPAYLSLFGKSAASALAVYTHHHDHKHDLQGNIVEHNCSGKHADD